MATKTYTWKSALFDLLMIAITGGFWVLWVIVRFLRTH
jgi:hypothetical protein